MSEPEILAELSRTPTGPDGLKKCLTAVHTDRGLLYSVRSLAPRPDLFEPTSYVPARGIDLSEPELKEFCSALQKNLFYFRKQIWETPEASHPIFIHRCGLLPEQDRNMEQIEVCQHNGVEIEDELDVCSSFRYEKELHCDFIAVVKTLPAEYHDYVKRLSILDWEKNDSVTYDLRIWRNAVTETGYIEMTPIPDQGITLTDIEAEKLCMIAETLFPDLAQNVSDFCGTDYEEKSTTVDLNLSDEEQSVVQDALGYHEDHIRENFSHQMNRGCYISSDCASYYVRSRLPDTERKIMTGERLTDAQLYACVNALEEAIKNGMYLHEPGDSDEIMKELLNRMSVLKDERDRTNGLPNIKSQTASFDLSVGECEILLNFLQAIYEKLYNSSSDSSFESALKKVMDEAVLNDVELRNIVSELDPEYHQTPGQYFLERLIAGLQLTLML